MTPEKIKEKQSENYQDIQQKVYLYPQVKTKGCPPDGLRSYPKHLMRLVPPKGLLFVSIIYLLRFSGQLFVITFTKNIIIMKVQVNNKEVELTTGNTISALAAQLDLPPQGVAIALNNRMIPRSQWEEQDIQHGESRVIINAECGG